MRKLRGYSAMITKIAKMIRFTGMVQGVGFRYVATTVARRFSVTGYVQNMPDGGVELYVEGPQDEIDEYLDILQKEMQEYITQTETKDIEPSGEYTRFIVKY
jgi:acylphosphatase